MVIVKCRSNKQMYYLGSLWAASKTAFNYFELQNMFGILSDPKECDKLDRTLKKLCREGYLEREEKRVDFMTSTYIYKATQAGSELAKSTGKEEIDNKCPVTRRLMAKQMKRTTSHHPEFKDGKVEEFDEVLYRKIFEKPVERCPV